MGFTPTTPHSAAGWRIEPPVSDPSASGANPAATAAALPPDEPPGTRVGSCGFRVGPNAEFSVEEPMANSSRLVLPTETAPARRRRSTTVASYGGLQPSRILELHVVGMPVVQRLSFSATGTPASGPGSPPLATTRSTSSAAAQRRVGRDEVERVELGLPPLDAGQVLLDHLPGGTLPRPDGGCDRDGAVPARPSQAHGASPSTGGTRNIPSSVAGASASTASRMPATRTSSGRVTLASG